jgi:hypothetical protein
MFVIQNQRFIHQVFFGVPFQPILLTIEGKWFQTIMHMKKFEFPNLARPKQVQFLIAILCGKFQLLPTSALVGF